MDRFRRIQYDYSGMFAYLGRYLDVCYFLQVHNLIPIPTWYKSHYSDDPDVDVWDWFFDRDHAVCEAQYVSSPNIPPYYKIVGPRTNDIPSYEKFQTTTSGLAPPKNRRLGAELIAKYVHPKSFILDRVEGFYQNNLKGHHIIGVHLRGPGGIHSGVPLFNHILGEDNPPYTLYFQKIDACLDFWDDVKVVLCTDAGCVQKKVKARYGNRVICTTSGLREEGEGHLNHEGKSPIEFGIEALTDAYLLGLHSDVFIHGCSYLSNFVQCLNPDLLCWDVYEGCYCFKGISLRKTISQFGQDLFILDRVPNRGFFVDIGAGDGIKLSNTYLMEARGWHGICVEPHDGSFQDLKKNRSCMLDNRCVWKKSNERVSFLECGYLSGIKDCFADKHNRTQGQMVRKKTVSLNDLLDEFDAPRIIDYLSLDTEGSELNILLGFDFQYVFRFITVEHNRVERKKRAIERLLTQHGYKKIETKEIEDYYEYKDKCFPRLL